MNKAFAKPPHKRGFFYLNLMPNFLIEFDIRIMKVGNRKKVPPWVIQGSG